MTILSSIIVVVTLVGSTELTLPTILIIGAITNYLINKTLEVTQEFFSRDSRLIAELCVPEDGIAEECVVRTYNTRISEYGLDSDIPSTGVEVHSIPGVTEFTVKGEMDACTDTNVVRPDRKRNYVRSVVAEVKNRFGTPTDNSANRLAVRKSLLDIMKTHKLRPSHINQMIDLCVVLVFTPNDVELVASTLNECREVTVRRGYNDNFLWKLLHCFCNRQTVAET